MSAPRLTVGEIFRRYGDDFLDAFGHVVSRAHRLVLEVLAACRTIALGGHIDRCNSCGQTVIAYNSCFNRHCPHCRAGASREWLAARQSELLPAPHFHVVFTLPHELGPLALQNKRVMYNLLFEIVAETLFAITSDPNHLGVRIGFMAVLHTWGQLLQHHPHIHCVIPGGGLTPDGTRWIFSGDRYFVPVQVLSRLFRGKFLQRLRHIYKRGRLEFHGALAPLADPLLFEDLLDSIRKKDWVVYAKRPFAGPEQVLQYLARYTHRVAITNSRLMALDHDQVTFRWKDYTNHNQIRSTTVRATEFIRRFLLHVLPSGFVRIRYYGLLANRHRKANIDLCRRLIDEQSPTPTASTSPPQPLAGQTQDAVGNTSAVDRPCPFCKTGRLLFVRDLKPFEVYPTSPSIPTTQNGP